MNINSYPATIKTFVLLGKGVISSIVSKYLFWHIQSPPLHPWLHRLYHRKIEDIH